MAALALYNLAITTLRGTRTEMFKWRQLLTYRRAHKVIATFIAILIIFWLISLGAIQGSPYSWPLLDISLREKEIHLGRDALDQRTWVPRLTKFFGYSAFADLRNAEISVKKPAWTQQNADDPDSVVAADLYGINLRGADLAGAFLAYADLGKADLTGATFFDTNLRNSRLAEANLTRAWIKADLTGADLRETILTGVVLLGSDFRKAKHLNIDQVCKDSTTYKDSLFDDDKLKALDLPENNNQRVLSKLNEPKFRFFYEIPQGKTAREGVCHNH